MDPTETLRVDIPTLETMESLWRDNVPVAHIAERYGVSRHRVAGWAATYGLKARIWVTPDPHRSGRLKELKKLWENPAVTSNEIARRFECSSSLVRKWGVDYKLGPKAVYDKYGPQPGDPSPEEIAAAAAEIKRDHIRSKMVSPSDFPAEEQEDDEE
ncbi:hypothetical protein UFOVP898_9 [uncultured Caudovirales phage]|uniref:Uncharacterized protein n=1 Tax=uncultured Caudovirales phage TaxID=2100421 RepID=A0A6J5QC01_9CAUD|nr:hypothetical protein UFOVP898_9 [uncultured Caudovirales phage]CAB4176675.1 hypothetical protein UFOVP985_50 [uncultured Caudovirales phage]CAB4181042.1 hypothetical protein UFOVP1073_7 [uncultured Caudovirales phage]CAB4198038.1 hypothetical protein UFOVP1308_46 [uncultured Caudovirales phage]CAB4210497.1 hypothetical protein UFOVP1423_23 [uncultured Caudovirales phage]